MCLFDSHCHIQDALLRPSLAEVLDRASEAGVRRLLSCGTQESDWDDVLKLGEHKSGMIQPALGLHPMYADGAGSEWFGCLREQLMGCSAAVGEVGLDGSVGVQDIQTQERILRQQLSLAAELDRPVSLHCRRAWGRLLDVLRSAPIPKRGLVIHSYSGGPDLVSVLCGIGPVFFSFSGSITRSANKRGRAAALLVPADRLLIETDAPDIPPLGDDGAETERPNEPSRLILVARALAFVRGESVDRIADMTWDNACKVFGK